MGIFDDIAHSIGRDVRMGARKMLVPGLLALAGGLTGAAAVGFTTAWAYLTLSRTVGQEPATLLIGLGSALLAGGLVFLARRQLSKHDPEEPSEKPPEAPGKDTTDAAAQIAFAAAFVLARYLGAGKRD